MLVVGLAGLVSAFIALRRSRLEVKKLRLEVEKEQLEIAALKRAQGTIVAPTAEEVEKYGRIKRLIDLLPPFVFFLLSVEAARRLLKGFGP